MIFGASSGIGKELSKAFHEEGAYVIATYFENKIDKIYDERWDAFYCDITNYDEIVVLRDYIFSRFLKIDIAINCTGIINDSCLSSMGIDMWSKVIDVNLTGSMNFIKAFAEKMKLQSSGKIFLLSSIQGLNGRTNQSNYSASKAGVFALAKVAAKEYASYSLQINTICPGYIETNMNKEQFQKKEEAVHCSCLPIENNLSDLINFMLFISSELVNSVTGQNFIIDSRL